MSSPGAQAHSRICSPCTSNRRNTSLLRTSSGSTRVPRNVTSPSTAVASATRALPCTGRIPPNTAASGSPSDRANECGIVGRGIVDAEPREQGHIVVDLGLAVADGIRAHRHARSLRRLDEIAAGSVPISRLFTTWQPRHRQVVVQPAVTEIVGEVVIRVDARCWSDSTRSRATSRSGWQQSCDGGGRTAVRQP